MIIMSEQQRLNEEIAYELDKYQVMLEYGRIYLDYDRAIRKKYAWMNYANFMHRKQVANLISAEDKDKLKSLLDNLQTYLHKLGEWMKDVDSHIKQNKSVLDIIEKDLAVTKSQQAKEVNKLSEIYGELDEERDAKAHKMAEERLQQYKRFIYDYE